MRGEARRRIGSPLLGMPQNGKDQQAEFYGCKLTLDIWFPYHNVMQRSPIQS